MPSTADKNSDFSARVAHALQETFRKEFAKVPQQKVSTDALMHGLVMFMAHIVYDMTRISRMNGEARDSVIVHLCNEVQVYVRVMDNQLGA